MSYSLSSQQLGHYELLGGLGRGAMSEVYIARDLQLDRLVAVKVLSEQIVRRADGVARFEREAQAAARLEHPNVATVFYSSTHIGKPFYAMELIRGWSFQELIESRVSYSLAQLLPLFAQACAGIGAAYLAGVTHRDVKPGNLMITEAGLLKVVDFGLARLSEEGSRSQKRGIMGTPYYIAPEVIKGSQGDHRSDLYSLGVTFWEILIGRPPFDGDTPRDVLRMHLEQEAPRIDSLNPELPSGLSNLVAELMAKDPANRPEDYREVLDRLRTLPLSGSKLERRLRWCNTQSLNTFSEEEHCSLCSRPYTQRSRPESFHVDLVAWRKSDAQRAAAEYIATALGQPPEDIEPLLEPLPFRAAFRAHRGRARRMHREFHELGAEVELVPADDAEARGSLPIRTLPVSPAWPQGENLQASGNWSSAASSRTIIRERRRLELLTAILTALTLLLGVMFIQTNAQLQSSRSKVAGLEARLLRLATDVVRASSTVQPKFLIFDSSLTLDKHVRETAEAELSRSVGAVSQKLTSLGSIFPLEVQITASPLLGPSGEPLWREALWAPRLEFPASGITQVTAAQLSSISRNLITRSALRKACGPMTPGWLLIGLSTLMESGTPEPAAGDVSPGQSIRSIPAAPGEASQADQERAVSFVDFLVRRGGWESINGVIRALMLGKSSEEALLRTYGVSVEELEAEWIRERSLSL